MIKSTQPVACKIIENSLIKNKMSHAYLISGKENGLEFAYWLAAVKMKKTLDENQVFDCITRFKEGDHADFVVIDGSQETIKKDHVISLQEKFKNTALEIDNEKIAIIHHCQNATVQAMNSILKFIEEPSGANTTFIFTTDEVDKVISTIQSRCLILQLQKTIQTSWIEELETQGHDELLIQYVIRHFNDFTEVQPFLENKATTLSLHTLYDMLAVLTTQPHLACAIWGIECENQKESIILVIEFLKLFFWMKCFQYSFKSDVLNTYQSQYSLGQAAQLYTVCSSLISKISPSASIMMIVDEGCYKIVEELS